MDQQQGRTAAQAVVQTLVQHRLLTLFALPGVQNDHLFNALHDALDDIRIVHPRHEQGAGYMALGAAMATGRPSGCCVVPGPGVLNASAALCTAWAVGAPVLCLTGQLPSYGIGKGYGLLHEITDQLGVLRGLTKWAARIGSADEAAAVTEEAFNQLATGRTRPVAVECPLDIWPQRTTAEAPLPGPQAPPELDLDAIHAAADLLARAAAPMILVGGGAMNCPEEVRLLAEMLQAPVVSNRMGRGVTDDRHPLSLHAGIGHILWPKVDVVIAIGTRMQTEMQVWGDDEKLSVIRIEIDPEEMSRIRQPDIAILADAGTALHALLDALPGRLDRRTAPALDIDAARAEWDRVLDQLAPQRAWLQAIRAELPEDGIFVEEVTQLGHVSRVCFPVWRPRTHLSPGFQGTLGWGVSTAIGAQIACPDRPVVLVTGDGGFMFTMNELATAAQFNVPVVVLVMNDGAYGNVRRTQVEDFGNRTICTDLANPDMMKLADAFGIDGAQANTPEELRPVLRQAIARRRPTLIEAKIGPMPGPWQILRYKKVR
jgi:acetolactate synthase I/II/III large subunit